MLNSSLFDSLMDFKGLFMSILMFVILSICYVKLKLNIIID